MHSAQEGDLCKEVCRVFNNGYNYYHPYYRETVCEDNLIDISCKFTWLVEYGTYGSCLKARKLFAAATTNCKVKDSIQRVIRGVDFVFKFATNCARFRIDFPAPGCPSLSDCVKLLVESDGKTVNCSKKDAANQCYEDILQRENCDFTGPIQDLIIGQFLPMVCPVIETDLPKCYK
ncbi:hypothetical protein EB796_018472 [Bugula neritina]|uniref:Uncharacterized protein n=1 Tax=Bugula neritina TaxID=10212 RepID=A0A7J7JB70_BUGNE|nr:hypothetical protein EB796_018472 [Bugula neritina]